MKKNLVTCLILVICQSILGQKSLTLEEAVRQQFTVFYPDQLNQLQWLSNSDSFIYQKGDTVWTKDARTLKNTVYITLAELNQITNEGWKNVPALRPKENEIIEFKTTSTLENKEYLYGIDLKNRGLAYRMLIPEEDNIDWAEGTHHICFTRSNELYILQNGKEIQVTQSEKNVVNGQSISRNEYGISKGTFWSPNGNDLAFYVKNEANVADYPLTDYSQVPAMIKNIKYPMAGGSSEIVWVEVYHLNPNGQNSKTKLDISDENGVINDNYYVTNLAWTPDSKSILIAWLNRKTDKMKLDLYSAETGKKIRNLFEENDTKWVEPDVAPFFIDNHHFLWRSYATKSGYHNFLMYDLNGKKLGEISTPFEQLSISKFCKNTKTLYLSCATNLAMDTQEIAVNIENYSWKNITPNPGIHQLQVSESGNYLLDQYHHLQTPNAVKLLHSDGKEIATIHNAKDKLSNYKIGLTELGQIKGHDGTVLNYRVIKPSNFDPSKKYPVLVYVYNGPHVQLVNHGYGAGASLWMNYFAEKGYIIFTLDGRGSANRGKEFEQAIHRQLGTVEMDDQMSGVEWLRSQPYVDDSKLAIHGWSFGGFMTTSLMLRQPGVFKCGVAGGPVLDWNLYEVMYTERYMDTPTENPEGYKNNELGQYVRNLSGPLLMIHGTDDDVVVMQHNMRFLKSCITNNVPIDFFAYPGHAHNVRGKDRVHLMHKILDYVEHELNHP